ncbi:MAG: hypothetical protein R3B68_00400 [Phycisphaerales bacterium]
MPARRFARSALAACTLLGVLAGSAPAALVFHDNSDLTFTWSRSVLPVLGPIVDGRVLDPTLPAAQQTGAVVDHAFRWLGYEPVTSSEKYAEDLTGVAATSRVARSSQLITVGIPSADFFPVETFPLGGSVGPAETWQSGAMGYSDGFVSYQGAFLGSEAYAGIRFELAGAVHYGWIRLGLVASLGPAGHYEPTAWAYETTPGTPAQIIPAPACGLFGLFLLAPRRRRM